MTVYYAGFISVTLDFLCRDIPFAPVCLEVTFGPHCVGSVANKRKHVENLGRMKAEQVAALGMLLLHTNVK